MRSKKLLIVAYKAFKRGEEDIAKDIFVQAMGDASSPGLMEELYKSDNDMRGDDVTIPGAKGNEKGDMSSLEKAQDEFGMGEEPDEKGKPTVKEPVLDEQDMELAELEDEEDSDEELLEDTEEEEAVDEEEPILSTAAVKKLRGIANRIAAEDGGEHRDIAKKLLRTVKAFEEKPIPPKAKKTLKKTSKKVSKKVKK